MIEDLCLGSLALSILILICLSVMIAKAPYGYEDEKGYHEGREKK